MITEDSFWQISTYMINILSRHIYPRLIIYPGRSLLISYKATGIQG